MFSVDALNMVVAETFKEQFIKSPIEVYLTQSPTLDFEKDELKKFLTYLEAAHAIHLSI